MLSVEKVQFELMEEATDVGKSSWFAKSGPQWSHSNLTFTFCARTSTTRRQLSVVAVKPSQQIQRDLSFIIKKLE